MERTDIKFWLSRARGLAVFHGVLETPGVRTMLAVLGLLAKEEPDADAVAEGYGSLWRELADAPELLLPDAWRSYLVRGVLEDENPFSLSAEKRTLTPALVEQTRRELRFLQTIFDLESDALLRMVEAAAPDFEGFWVAPHFEQQPDVSPRRGATRMLAEAVDWGDCVEGLAEHFAGHGAGLFGRHAAFRWRGGQLVPVPRPDPIYLSELVGYERERAPLVANTQRFLAGLPAHHALLYGPPGTGKSSTVKALLNEYSDRGLRIVELDKQDLGELPEVLRTLERRGPRFILFVDDLSFEEHEVEYKRLKAFLEGSVEEPPANVRLYATSNRRNIVREGFSERDGDDVHARDTMQEKLSLGARFGLRVTFPAPDQSRYLQIVSGLARQRGIKLATDEVEEQARLWDHWHAGRSGRTARQFVDELQAEMAEGRNAGL